MSLTAGTSPGLSPAHSRKKPVRHAIAIVFFGALAIGSVGKSAVAAVQKKPKRVKTASGTNRAPAQAPSLSKEAPGLIDLNSSDHPDLRNEILRPLSEECNSGNPDQLCIGLKYVVFKKAKGQPSLPLQDAAENIRTANRVWKKCGIAFQIDKYTAVDPGEHQVKYNLADYKDLTAVRRTFGEPDKLLIAATGAWNRKGTLGNTTANAWTSLPPAHAAGKKDGPFGAIIEAPVATNGHLVAHELGHYLNLLHAQKDTSVMNPVIYRRSVDVSPDECALARDTARVAWAAMLR